MASIPPVCDFGWKAPGFLLPATDGKFYGLKDISGANGTLIMFICNHCPYVQSVLDRVVRDARDLKELGIGVAAVSSNDVKTYPQDSFENMKKLAKDQDFPFPYLYDETQKTARDYKAVCTPDFYGFNGCEELQYRGRLDASGRNAGPTDLRRDLYEAMKQIVETGQGPRDQIASVGCSIKWKMPKKPSLI